MSETSGTVSVDDFRFLLLAYRIAQKSPCERKHVGCVIVEHQELYIHTPKLHRYALGYNRPAQDLQQFCPGQEHCRMEKPTGWSGCLRTIHAEPMAILDAMRKNLQLDLGTAYCTTKPCLECAKLLVASGVRRCVFGDINEGIPPQFSDLVDVLKFEQVSAETLERMRKEYGE